MKNAKLIDTHCHLDYDEYKDNLPQIIEEAAQAGVEKIIIPGVTLEDTPKIIKIIDKYDNIYGAVGIHPTEAQSRTESSYAELKQYAQHKKIVGIGETGLDFYHDKSFCDLQKNVFREHIRLAQELNKPLIVHDRDAHGETMHILKETKAVSVGVIMHCFSGSVEFMKECVKEGFYIALGGPVTFKNAKAPKEVAKAVPLDRLVVETDAPFLTPHPYRGKTNYPAFVSLTAQEIANLKEISLNELAEVTTANAQKIFKL